MLLFEEVDELVDGVPSREMAVFYDLFDFRERIFILCVLPREELDSFGDRQNRIVAVVAVLFQMSAVFTFVSRFALAVLWICFRFALALT